MNKGISIVHKTVSALFSADRLAASRYQHRKRLFFGRVLPPTLYYMYNYVFFSLSI